MRFQDPEFWRQLERMIEDERIRHTDALALGRIMHADYDKEIGFLRGLNFVKDKAAEVIEKMNGADTSESTLEEGAA